MIDSFYFDLDGTLLPMENQDLYLQEYFKTLTDYFSDFDGKMLIKAMMIGTKAMLDNNGSYTNEKVFWEVFTKLTGTNPDEMQKRFVDYYLTDFKKTKKFTGINPYAKKIIDALKEKGYKIILATNPLFPKIATYQRIEWAGLNPDDFIHVTTYENSSFSKPNPLYLEEIERITGEVNYIMIGNDTDDDKGAYDRGKEIYFVKDCLINKNGVKIDKGGSLEELYNWVMTLDFIKR